MYGDQLDGGLISEIAVDRKNEYPLVWHWSKVDGENKMEEVFGSKLGAATADTIRNMYFKEEQGWGAVYLQNDQDSTNDGLLCFDYDSSYDNTLLIAFKNGNSS